MTPAARELLRARQRRIRDAAREKLAKQRFTDLSVMFAAFMVQEWREGRACTLFAHEADIRHALRAVLCLQGWGWHTADQVARDVVAAALSKAGAKRPSWDEGQRQEQERFIQRTRCVVCHRPLPEERRALCSTMCGRIMDARRWRRRGGDTLRVSGLLAGEHDEP